MQRSKKDSVSITICIGRELFDMLNSFCEVTGQSKTVAVERAIRSYCRDSVAGPDADIADTGRDAPR